MTNITYSLSNVIIYYNQLIPYRACPCSLVEGSGFPATGGLEAGWNSQQAKKKKLRNFYEETSTSALHSVTQRLSCLDGDFSCFVLPFAIAHIHIFLTPTPAVNNKQQHIITNTKSILPWTTLSRIANKISRRPYKYVSNPLHISHYTLPSLSLTLLSPYFASADHYAFIAPRHTRSAFIYVFIILLYCTLF